MATVLSHQLSTGPKPKTHISLGSLPPFISSKEPPTRKSPWRQIREMPFISSVTLTLPSDLHAILWPLLQPSSSSSGGSSSSSSLSLSRQYAKVILKLSDILTGDFYTTYIKTRTVQLISEGEPGVSDWFCTVHDGHMRIEMARDIYERCGVQGHPTDRNGGARKHGKDRWVVDFNLREASMVRGRKGFERLVRAAEQVLDQAKVWLFQDLGATVTAAAAAAAVEGETVIARFHPTFVEVQPEVVERRDVLIPSVVSTPQDVTESRPLLPPPPELHDDYHSLTEWLDLVHLDSVRVTAPDDPDSYISRYVVPDAETSTAADLTVVRWAGLLDRAWCVELLIEVARLSRGVAAAGWVTCSVTSHRTEALGQVDGCVVLLRAGVQVSTQGSGMDVDTTRDGQGDASMDKGNNPAGELTHFTCFQFVDALR